MISMFIPMSKREHRVSWHASSDYLCLMPDARFHLIGPKGILGVNPPVEIIAHRYRDEPDGENPHVVHHDVMEQTLVPLSYEFCS